MTGEDTSTTNPSSPSIVSAAAVALHTRIASRAENSDRERGATLVEYGFLILLVALVGLVTLQVLGVGLIEVFQESRDTLNNANSDA